MITIEVNLTDLLTMTKGWTLLILKVKDFKSSLANLGFCVDAMLCVALVSYLHWRDKTWHLIPNRRVWVYWLNDKLWHCITSVGSYECKFIWRSGISPTNSLRCVMQVHQQHLVITIPFEEWRRLRTKIVKLAKWCTQCQIGMILNWNEEVHAIDTMPLYK